MLEKMKAFVDQKRNVEEFITKRLWQFRIKDIPFPKAMFFNAFRIFALTVRGFREDNCILRASALTFYTVLSIVPVLAMAFGIAKGFGFESVLEEELMERFVFQKDALSRVFVFANELLEKTKGGVIAGVGVGILFWTVLKVLSHIERSFNKIWKVSSSRSIGRKFNDYFAVMMICPLLIIVHGSLSVFITVQVKTIMERIALIGIFSPIIFTVLKLLPYALIWILLFYIYKVLPFTEIKISSAIIAGILAGTIFQTIQWIYIYFQVGVSQYNAIYGSFAALPLFMIWLQISWMIVLFGAEFSYAFENVNLYEFETEISNMSYSHKKFLYVTIVHLLTRNFSEGQPPLNEKQISEKLGIPRVFVRKSLEDLKQADLISDAQCEKGTAKAYLPAHDIRKYRMWYVIKCLETSGTENIPINSSDSVNAIKEILRKFGETLENSPENELLENIDTKSKHQNA